MKQELQHPTLYMLVGIPGCGKSTWAGAMENQGIHVHSSDLLRKELLRDESCQDNPQMIFGELKKRILEDLKRGHSCIYDATNMSRKRRKNFLDLAYSLECRKVCVLFLTPLEVCAARDRLRRRMVGERVIDRILRTFEAYRAEQEEKIRILEWLLQNCNDGRKKTFFCVAVNLLELEDMRNVMGQIKSAEKFGELPLKEKAAYVTGQFQKAADKQGVLLKLRKKPTNKKMAQMDIRKKNL